MADAFQMFYDFILKYWLIIIFALFVLHQVYDHYTFKALLEKVGKEFCAENNFEYVGIKHAQAHFSVIYKDIDSEKRKYKKFRMNTFLWKITYLEWLK